MEIYPLYKVSTPLWTVIARYEDHDEVITRCETHTGAQKLAAAFNSWRRERNRRI